MRLLIVEDEKDLAEALGEILTMNKYSVDIVHDGEEALYYVEDCYYDGIILDVMIPKIDGFEVLRTIRERGNSVPVIMLTAKAETDDKVTGLDLGADDYLSKPFDTKELLARVRAITRREINKSGSELKRGNIILNQSTYEMTTESGKFTLANKEYQLMEMLLANPDKCLSTEKLMVKIWGYESDSEINVVWVHISSLRKKLLSLNANIIIKSSRGRGYYLEEISNKEDE